MEQDDLDVGFLYKTMLQRDPRKRRVKPVQKHLIQLDFGGLGDSSDDSDFEVSKHKDGSDSDASDNDNDGSESDDESESESDEDDEDGEEEGSEEDESSVATEAGMSFEMMLEKAKNVEVERGQSEASSSKLRIVICCVCLGESSEEQDEIVECDGCGVSVHEGCYGISESTSIASTESSASTEPWFCDGCKAGVKPSCELCPNSGGIYKETDTGRWVHIVCALYIPGVAFGEVDKLSPVTLFEMSYTKWGAKECTLCEDERFSRTGVCIGCDAGMCRNYFHVTCAQRLGLLSEASPDEDIADPFYAYCKQHAEKFRMKAQRKNFLAVQSHIKSRGEVKIQDEKERLRFERKLNRHRQKYAIAKAKRPPPWMPNEKVPRMLTTSATAVRRLMKKAELMGINTHVQNVTTQKDIRKKWHVAPALSVEFVSYFIDREVRMKSMKSHFNEAVAQREKLQNQEKILRKKYEQLSNDIGELRDSANNLRNKGEKYWKQLGDMIGKVLPLPSVLKPKKIVKQVKKETPRSPPGIIHQCGICHKTSDQHLLAKCDSCKLYYHLGCLDPPLTRMPKKSKLFGWQCSECVSSSSDESKEAVEMTNAPRRLREKIKEPVKFTPPTIKQKKRSTLKKQGLRKTIPKAKLAMSTEELTAAKSGPIKIEDEDDMIIDDDSSVAESIVKADEPATSDKKRKRESEEDSGDTELTVKKEPLSYASRPMRKIRKIQDVRTECVCCGKPGDNSNLVRCDDCKLCYHFQCLDPPAKKTPKQRGYAWYCTACDPTEESEEEDLDEEEPEEAESKNKVTSDVITIDDDDEDELQFVKEVKVATPIKTKDPTKKFTKPPMGVKLTKGFDLKSIKEMIGNPTLKTGKSPAVKPGSTIKSPQDGSTVKKGSNVCAVGKKNILTPGAGDKLREVLKKLTPETKGIKTKSPPSSEMMKSKTKTGDIGKRKSVTPKRYLDWDQGSSSPDLGPPTLSSEKEQTGYSVKKVPKLSKDEELEPPTLKAEVVQEESDSDIEVRKTESSLKTYSKSDKMKAIEEQKSAEVTSKSKEFDAKKDFGTKKVTEHELKKPESDKKKEFVKSDKQDGKEERKESETGNDKNVKEKKVADDFDKILNKKGEGDGKKIEKPEGKSPEEKQTEKKVVDSKSASPSSKDKASKSEPEKNKEIKNPTPEKVVADEDLTKDSVTGVKGAGKTGESVKTLGLEQKSEDKMSSEMQSSLKNIEEGKKISSEKSLPKPSDKDEKSLEGKTSDQIVQNKDEIEKKQSDDKKNEITKESDKI